MTTYTVRLETRGKIWMRNCATNEFVNGTYVSAYGANYKEADFECEYNTVYQSNEHTTRYFWLNGESYNELHEANKALSLLNTPAKKEAKTVKTNPVAADVLTAVLALEVVAINANKEAGFRYLPTAEGFKRIKNHLENSEYKEFSDYLVDFIRFEFCDEEIEKPCKKQLLALKKVAAKLS